MGRTNYFTKPVTGTRSDQSNGGSNLVHVDWNAPKPIPFEQVALTRSRAVARAANNSPINYNITRETNNIPLPLPFALFAPDNRDENYATIFRNLGVAPAGGTVVVTIDSLGDILFTWTVAGNTDIIRIHSTKPVSAANQLSKINNGGAFISSGIRYGAMTTNFATQYASFDIFHGATYFVGPVDFDNTTVRSQKSPVQFQDPIIDVPIELAIDASRFLVCGFPSDAVNTPNLITWSFFDVEFMSPGMFGEGR